MKTYNYCLSLLFLFITVSLNGQDVSTKKITDEKNNYNLIIKKPSNFNSKYLYQDKIFDKKQLREILMNDQLALNFYEDYESRNSTSKTFGLVSGGLVIVSVIYLTTADSEGDAYIGFLSALGGLGSIIIAMGTSNSAGRKLDKSIDFFNGNVKNRESLGVIPIQLNLQNTQNGIGLVLNF